MYPRLVNSSDSWARDWRIIRSHSTLRIATLLLVSIRVRVNYMKINYFSLFYRKM